MGAGKKSHSWLAAILLLLSTAVPLYGQTSSGTITGHVVDSSDKAVPGATVTLTRADTGEQRTFVSNDVGEFFFESVQPGTYRLAVDLDGFKHYEQRGISLSSSERLSAGDLKLEVGGISEAVEVVADVAKVQSASSERSAVLDSNQVTNLMSRGRDVMALLSILPGVVQDGEGNDSLGVFNSPAAISGTRGIYNGMNIDGISGNTRSGDHLDTPLNMDAIAEVKVLMNSYQAEYGKGAGGIINVVSKTGTSTFHGAGYDYVRNDAFNANNFFNNRQGLPKNDYKFNTFGYNLGGPVSAGNSFNAGKDKLFFFFSQEILHNREPNGPRNYTVPTALERQGDFSQSIDVSTLRPIVVKDPVTGRPFPGNIIPPNRIDPNLQKLLNIFPLPNVKPDANHHFNLQLSDSLDRPVRQEILRLDYNMSSKVRAWFRGMNMSTHNTGLASTTNKFAWGLPMDYGTTGPNVGGNVTWIISPTLVHEFTLGWSQWTELQTISPDVLSRIQKANLGVTLGQLYPANNPLGMIPSITFGTSIANAATTAYDARFPLNDDASTWSVTDSITKVWREHQFKAGIQAERVIYNQYHTGSGNFAGTFNFAPNSAFPADSGYAYANALLGNFQDYTESTNRVNYSPITRIFEWYVQDSWKAASRLTLDLGMRFTAGLPQVPNGHAASTFVPSLYDPARAPVLYRSGLDAQGRRVAIDPRCPSCPPQPAALIGFIIPGSGDLLNGIVTTGTPGYPRGLVDFQGILPAPRLGFAWDPTGSQRTAVRGGFGVNYNPRNGAGILGDTTGNPPQVYNPQQFYGNTATFLQVGNFQAPSNINQSLNRSNPPPKVYNTSVGVQREIGFGTTIDIAYVGSFGRNIGQKHDINQVPLGAHFMPQNQDPTQPGKPLPDQFLRPYMGFGSIPFLTFNGTSKYNSLQAQAIHRLSHGVQFGVAYTLSRAYDYTEADQGAVSSNPLLFNYGLAGYDRTHVVAIHYSIDLPKASHVVDTAFVRTVLDGWQFVGTTRLASGAPLYWGWTGTNSVSSNTFLGTGNLTPAVDITGGSEGWRPIVVGNPELPADQRTVDHWFNTAAFARPAQGTQGNAGAIVARGPGTNNWNMSLFKNMHAGNRTNLQLRVEAYNVFNRTQFVGVDTVPKFDAQGNQVSQTFGQLATARDPRVMQFAIRVMF